MLLEVKQMSLEVKHMIPIVKLMSLEVKQTHQSQADATRSQADSLEVKQIIPIVKQMSLEVKQTPTESSRCY